LLYLMLDGGKGFRRLLHPGSRSHIDMQANLTGINGREEVATNGGNETGRSSIESEEKHGHQKAMLERPEEGLMIAVARLIELLINEEMDAQKEAGLLIAVLLFRPRLVFLCSKERLRHERNNSAGETVRSEHGKTDSQSERNEERPRRL